jgi:hypothetical protein
MTEGTHAADAFNPERELAPDETESQHMAKMLTEPHTRHAMLGHILAGTHFTHQRPTAADAIANLTSMGAEAETGDNAYASRVLVLQAATLDALFTEMTYRALQNRSQYPDAFNRYMGHAFKAQSNCRVTLEALAKLHAPREQVVRHVHVHEGGQAVVAEEFHHHARGVENAGSAEQAHAASNATVAGVSTALPRPDPLGAPMPVAGRARKEPMPNARRRKGQRGAEG